MLPILMGVLMVAYGGFCIIWQRKAATVSALMARGFWRTLQAGKRTRVTREEQLALWVPFMRPLGLFVAIVGAAFLAVLLFASS